MATPTDSNPPHPPPHHAPRAGGWVAAPFLLGYSLLAAAALHHFFFWDTVQLASLHGQWYWENGFRHLLLPDAIDSGHPPLFGLYVAAGWRVLGRSLATSHLLMLPLLWTIVWQTYRLVRHYVDPRYVMPAMALLLADPTLLAQATLVSPDLALMAFFLWALNAARRGERVALALALAGLALISTRGMMTCVVVFAYHVFCSRQARSRPPGPAHRYSVFRFLWPYLVGAAPAVAFLIFHLAAKGWVGYHAGSPWAPSFERVGWAGVARNVGLVGWRLLDFGRVFVWGVAAALLIRPGRRPAFPRLVLSRPARELLLLLAAVGVLLTPTLVAYRYLTGHRYLLPHYYTFALLVTWGLFGTRLPARWRWGGWAVALGGLLTGHLWVYPDRIAQGWDATLAHWGYYQVRRELLHEVRARNIDPAEVGSDFPNLATFQSIDLAGGDTAFAEKDLARQRYVFYTNVYNGFSDAELDTLQSRWVILHEARRGSVYGRLYYRGD